MSFYIILFLIVYLISFLDIDDRFNKYKIIAFIIIGAMCLFFSSIRWKTGTDWDPYYLFFTTNYSYSNFVNYDMFKFEYGFSLLNYIVKSMTDQYSMMLFVIAGIIIAIKYKCIWTLAPYPLLTLIVNFCDFNGDLFPVRQNISYAIVILSSLFIIKRELLKFILCVGIAASFHASAWIFFPAYWLYEIPITKKTLGLFVLLSVCIIGANTLFGESLSDIIFQIALGEKGLIASKLLSYQDEIANTNGTVVDILYSYIRLAILFIILMYCRRKYRYLYKFYDGFLVLWIIGIILRFLFADVSQTLTGRLVFYYSMLEIFLIPFIIMYFEKLKYRIVMCVLFGLYFGMKYYAGIYVLSYVFIPYRSIFW